MAMETPTQASHRVLLWDTLASGAVGLLILFLWQTGAAGAANSVVRRQQNFSVEVVIHRHCWRLNVGCQQEHSYAAEGALPLLVFWHTLRLLSGAVYSRHSTSKHLGTHLRTRAFDFFLIFFFFSLENCSLLVPRKILRAEHAAKPYAMSAGMQWYWGHLPT